MNTHQTEKATIESTSPCVTAPNEKVLWYHHGEPVMSDIYDGFGETYLKFLNKHPSYGFKPTTWEATAEFLKGEFKKPKESQDIFREICATYVLDVHNGQRIGYIDKITKGLVTLAKGQILLPAPSRVGLTAEILSLDHIGLDPSIFFPPHSFGTPKNPRGPLLVNLDPSSHVPPTATVIMAYFSRFPKEAPSAPGIAEAQNQYYHSPYE
ncbi:hypothetical protein BDZ94DRAFT_1312581 [Collybia nuda]|uniref:Uncharacterized protein n=1 Tax=Collybia nuda TaxID=64659 RepID=A0A9P6CEI8_9AGAR|nr:hypothetical protein BDZ94DRAFT_1312581 [Collybia nuda]